MPRKPKLLLGNKYIRKELNLLWDAVEKNKIALPRPGWAQGRSGVVPPTWRPVRTPFTPVLIGTPPISISFSRGWVFGPKAIGATNEIPRYQYFPFMPEIGSVSLDAGTAPTLGIGWNKTNRIYMNVPLTERVTPIGEYVDATNVPGKSGVRVYLSSDPINITATETASGHTHAIATTEHDHQAIIELSALNYHMTTTSAPSIMVTDGSRFPWDTLTAKNIPMGLFTFDATGVLNEDKSNTDWYIRENIYVKAPYFIRSDSASPSNPSQEPV